MLHQIFVYSDDDARSWLLSQNLPIHLFCPIPFRLTWVGLAHKWVHMQAKLTTNYPLSIYPRISYIHYLSQLTPAGGSWSALSSAGEATNLNLVHLMNVDCTDVEDITKVRRREGGDITLVPKVL